MRPRISIRGCVRPSVRWYVCMYVCYAFVKKMHDIDCLCTEMKKAYKVMNNIKTAL